MLPMKQDSVADTEILGPSSSNDLNYKHNKTTIIKQELTRLNIVRGLLESQQHVPIISTLMYPLSYFHKRFDCRFGNIQQSRPPPHVCPIKKR